MVNEVLSLPTLIPIGVILVWILLWFFRSKLTWLIKGLGWLKWAAEHSFGFEAINTGVVKAAEGSAEGLRATQTGLLAYNILAVLGTIIILFTLFAIGV